jgi:hypothetical protein
MKHVDRVATLHLIFFFFFAESYLSVPIFFKGFSNEGS